MPAPWWMKTAVTVSDIITKGLRDGVSSDKKERKKERKSTNDLETVIEIE